MNRDKNGFTPRESVYSFVIDTLRQHYHLPSNPDNTPSFSAAWQKAAARLHNKLLDESGLEGLDLPVVLNEVRAPAAAASEGGS